MYMTVEQFEQGRLSLALEGFLMVLSKIKKVFHNYMEYRQKQADRIAANYFKNHADFEKYQRELANQRNLPLFYARA